MKRATAHDRTQAHDAFPLRTVAAMTGLTPDRIRAWEKRYAVVAPVRGARGARLYCAADIAPLRVLARVVDAGRAIGDVASLSLTELTALFSQSHPADEAARTLRRWRLFFLACAEMFAFASGSAWGVGHYRFVQRG